MSNFYCQIKCVSPTFSIDEWDKSYKEIESMPISEAEKKKLLFPEPCKEQCFDCISIVGERRLKTQKLMKGQK